MIEDGEPTPPVDEFLATYADDDNIWWAIACGHHQNLFEAAVEDRDHWRGVALGSQPLDVHEVVARLIDSPDDGRRYDGISAVDFVCAYNRLVSEQMHDLKQRARKAESRQEELEQAIADHQAESREGEDPEIRDGHLYAVLHGKVTG